VRAAFGAIPLTALVAVGVTALGATLLRPPTALDSAEGAASGAVARPAADEERV